MAATKSCGFVFYTILRDYLYSLFRGGIAHLRVPRVVAYVAAISSVLTTHSRHQLNATGECRKCGMEHVFIRFNARPYFCRCGVVVARLKSFLVQKLDLIL